MEPVYTLSEVDAKHKATGTFEPRTLDRRSELPWLL